MGMVKLHVNLSRCIAYVANEMLIKCILVCISSFNDHKYENYNSIV